MDNRWKLLMKVNAEVMATLALQVGQHSSWTKFEAFPLRAYGHLPS